MNLIESLHWRYATKRMTSQKVPQDKVERILEAARLAPTSSGLQPFEVIVVTNSELKEKLRTAASNQAVVTECSHLLVFAAWDTYTPERINTMFDLVNEVRGTSNEGWENYRKFLLNTYPGRSAEENFVHTAKQAYIALGVALAAAAEEKVDSTPMEGFDPKAFDEILGLRAKGLRSAVILTLGYRDASSDWLANLKKVRKSRENFITEMK